MLESARKAALLDGFPNDSFQQAMCEQSANRQISWAIQQSSRQPGSDRKWTNLTIFRVRYARFPLLAATKSRPVSAIPIVCTHPLTDG